MNLYFLEFRDPLFGIIIFFIIIFVITALSYWFNKLKKREDYKHLDNFLKQFHEVPSQNELEVLVSKGCLSEKSWLLLANSFTKSGNYEKSIEIYSQLLKVADKTNYRDTLFLLGKTFYMAGFLERAKQTFLEILKNNPRTPQALSYLLLVYEQMKNYTAALDVLEPLSELKKDISVEEAYLNALIILNDVKISSEDKAQKLLEIYKKTNQMTHMIFEYLFRVNPKIAWENLDISKSALIVDILWQCDKKDLNFDIIMQNSFLKELYSAKKYIKEANGSFVFELDLLINLNPNTKATLGFEYVCDNCNQTYPFAFHRCSNCHAIEKMRVELLIVKDYHRDFSEESNSFL
ncbi:MAG: lipopolysaccharide assembly protein [Campylobacterota bacterium]|nr:lipopolysaccharide assembly protein [Campylobacterota bacterium]